MYGHRIIPTEFLPKVRQPVEAERGPSEPLLTQALSFI